MSFRSRTAPSEEDARIAQHIDRAIREVEGAMGVARKAAKTAGFRGRRVEREISRVLSALNAVGSVANRFGDDPDQMPEEERVRLWREKREQERLARVAEVTSGQ
jgi:hypothetical protein